MSKFVTKDLFEITPEIAHLAALCEESNSSNICGSSSGVYGRMSSNSAGMFMMLSDVVFPKIQN